MAKKKNKNRIGFFAVVVTVLAVVWAGNVFADFFGISGSGEVRIVVSPGESAMQIAENLKESGAISSKLLFYYSSRALGYSGDFKSGSFQISKGDSYFKIFKKLSSASLPENAVLVTVPEGFELRQIADKLEKLGLIDRDKFYYEIENGVFYYPFLEDIANRENRLEGYLFPDTYLFSKTDGEHVIIDAMLRRFNEVFTDTFSKRANELGISIDEVITLASIIEREALGDDDRGLVSSVFHNRLNSSQMPYLQSCATVQYILKERKDVLSVSDTKIESPYNTYINKGLPPGPIASPGEKAIYAALYPEKSDYLFFVRSSDGKHLFSKTYQEHLENEKK